MQINSFSHTPWKKGKLIPNCIFGLNSKILIGGELNLSNRFDQK